MRTVLALAFFVPGLILAGPGKATDLHRFWEQTCGDCHPHAGAFAQRFLTVKNGKLQGGHHKDDLLVFLNHHYLPQDLVQPMYEMLLAQASTPPRFKERCGRCHETAADLARESLVVRDGVLQSRESGRPVAEFLPRHAKLGLTPEETAFFVDLLTRVEREVHSGG
ncbi:hypothetical protein [Azospirillum rugosum]|uniref:Cytochrome c domain-containing protein n=1 Tax=Azospirillum rugosum TaxID=416170 RepID=A0ABS4SVL6_9PROT|nr:hypothetical protein [Azospirillum rugosum]MBP2296254.1 hypothetical protein [Azospirillum rugosum]MDQ0529775.1 hypothetical protein [Azospirillum rugosum]